MNRLRFLLFGCGVLLFGVLLVRLGLQPIMDALGRLSWGLLIILWFPFVLINICDTLGWRFAFPQQRVPFAELFMARLAGEAFNATTPGASVAGEPIKAVLIRRHVEYHESAASLVLGKTTITISQVLFLAMGLACMPRRGVDPRLLHALSIALVLEVVATGGFVLVQATGLLGAAAMFLRRFGFTSFAQGGAATNQKITEYYRRRPAALAGSVGLHFVGWVLSAGETLLILTMLGIPVSVSTALGIEAAGTAIRFASFFVPSHIGALEGGNVVTFVALGLDAGTGLAFTMIRRIRELAWIAAGLLVVGYGSASVVNARSPERRA